MTILTLKDLDLMEQRKRAAFVNCLSGIKSLNLIGTISPEKVTNLAIFNSCFHLGANPPLQGLISRPDSVDRGTLHNIQDTGFYTINHVHESFLEMAHQTSARYPVNESEFNATGLTEEFRGEFPAPFVKEARVKLGMKLVRTELIPENGVYLIIGEIQSVEFPEACLMEDGHLDLVSAGSLGGIGLDAYLRVEKLARLSYAKTDKPLQRL